jgi:hypothetical protein
MVGWLHGYIHTVASGKKIACLYNKLKKERK